MPLALGAARVIHGQLYGLAADDPVSFAGAVSVLIVTTLMAAYLPARRASRVEPMAALRTE